MTTLDHLNKITIYQISKYMSLDINARRNLEITEKMRDKSKKGTLLWVLDKTSTSMGGRMLRRWLNDPLIDTLEINNRLNAVKILKNDMILRGDITENLKKVYDIERLAGKMAYGNANARDMIKMCIRDSINIIHYNLGAKPWYFDDVLYQEYFWKYAEKTDFYNEIKEIGEKYTEADKEKDDANSAKLIELAQIETDCVGDDRINRR